MLIHGHYSNIDHIPHLSHWLLANPCKFLPQINVCILSILDKSLDISPLEDISVVRPTQTQHECLILLHKQTMYKTSIWRLSRWLNGSNSNAIIVWESGFSLDSNITAVDTPSDKHLVKGLPECLGWALCCLVLSQLRERESAMLTHRGPWESTT